MAVREARAAVHPVRAAVEAPPDSVVRSRINGFVRAGLERDRRDEEPAPLRVEPCPARRTRRARPQERSSVRPRPERRGRPRVDGERADEVALDSRRNGSPRLSVVRRSEEPARGGDVDAGGRRRIDRDRRDVPTLVDPGPLLFGEGASRGGEENDATGGESDPGEPEHRGSLANHGNVRRSGSSGTRQDFSSLRAGTSAPADTIIFIACSGVMSR